MNILLRERAYAVIGIVAGSLFLINYHIISPADFDSFSATLRYFVSALATLLAVVVSFNLFALRNQLNNMPNSIDRLEKQLEEISRLLGPLVKQAQEHKLKGDSFETATLYYTDAIKSAMLVCKELSETIAAEQEKQEKLGIICNNLARQIGYRLEMYDKLQSPYHLVSISTAYYVQKLRFANAAEDENSSRILDAIKRLHIIRNMCARIYLRNALSKLSLEMLVVTIPVIAFAAIVSSISTYESYSAMFLQSLFAASMSTVITPLILLLTRALPIIHLIMDLSSIPFARQR